MKVSVESKDIEHVGLTTADGKQPLTRKRPNGIVRGRQQRETIINVKQGPVTCLARENSKKYLVFFSLIRIFASKYRTSSSDELLRQRTSAEVSGMIFVGK